MSDEFDDCVQAFVAEVAELLEEMEAALLGLDENAEDPDHINTVFRAVHTIKGTAGLFAYDHVVAFTHAIESVLDCARNKEIEITRDLLSVMLASGDVTRCLVDAAVSGRGAGDEATQQKAAEIRGIMHALRPGQATSEDGNRDSGAGSYEAEHVQVSTKRWSIQIELGQSVFRNGIDPLPTVRYLGTIGTIVDIGLHLGDHSSIDEVDPETCSMRIDIVLDSTADKAVVEDTFQFMEDDCEISVLLDSDVDRYSQSLEKVVDERKKLGGILVESGAVTPTDVDVAFAAQADRPTPIGQVLVNQGAVKPVLVDVAVTKQQQARSGGSDGRFARVGLDKLESLTDLVGELVISGATTKLLTQKSADTALIASMENMGRLIEDIRDTALGLRMVQIGGTFNRFRRVVRDVSQKTGKEIELEISGQDTELDRAVVEKLADPLMHLVRNAVDHGIEKPEVRQERGKPPKGTLQLNAFHDSGSIVIEVRDDGGGLSAEKILNKAQRAGLIGPNQELTESDIYRLIFEPGFSTAEEVTDLSGRGVGLDVVNRNIEAMRGHVDVSSSADSGTRFRIRLPLTMAIIDGFLVRVGRSFYVIPLDMIEECTKTPKDRDRANADCDYVNRNGEVLPCVRLADQFCESGGGSKRESIVVVQFADQKAGLVVDELLGEYQTVIKPLGRIFEHLSGISGATILGSGAVALIIDVPALIALVTDSHEKLREVA